MKKLMTMIAAVGMAFGLFADEEVVNPVFNQVDFSKACWEGKTFSPLMTDEGVAAGDEEAVTRFWSYADAEFAGELTLNEGVLQVRSGQKVLSRNFSGLLSTDPINAAATAVAADDNGLFIDMNLNLAEQALDTAPTVADLTGAKLAIFALDTTDLVEGTAKAAETNLWVIGGYLGANGIGKRAFKLQVYNKTGSAVEIDSTFLSLKHRVTLKAYKTVTSTDGFPGFLLIIDGNKFCEVVGYADANEDGVFDVVNPITPSEEATSWDYLGANFTADPKVAFRYTARNLLLSMVGGTAGAADFKSVDFKGNANLNSLWLAKTAPADLADLYIDAWTLNIVKGNGLKSLTVAGEEVETGTIPFTPNASLEVVATYDTGFSYAANKFTLDNTAVADVALAGDTATATITPTDGATLSVAGFKAVAVVDIGGVQTPVESLAYALTLIGDGTGTITLTADTALDAGEIFSPVEGSTVTLDLAGKTITGGGDGESATTVIMNAGALTITNSTDTIGKIVPTDASIVAAVWNVGGTVAIQAGIYEGDVVEITEEDGLCNITATAGSFKKSDAMTQEAVEAFVKDETLEVANDGNYWTVQKAKAYVAQIGKDKYESLAAAFAAAANGDVIEVTANCTIDERIDVAAAGRSITLDATDFTVTCNCLYPIVWGDYDEENAGTLTVVGGTFQQDTEPDNGTPAMILWTKNGKIKVTGGTFNVTKGEGQVAYVGGAKAVNGSIEVTGGAFAICDKASGDKGDVFNVQNTLNVTQIKVFGGTFTKDLDLGDDYIGPTFVADGYASTFNSDLGLWQVVPAAVKVGNKGFADAAAALAAVQALEAAGTYPITVTALADLLIQDPQSTDEITLKKDGTITIIKDVWGFTGTVSGTVTLVDGKSIIVPEGSEITVNPAEGCMIKPATTEGVTSYTAHTIVVKVAAKDATDATPFFDVGDALAEVQRLEQNDEHFPIAVMAVQELEITGPNGQTITLAAKGTIAIEKNAWTIYGTVEGEVTLDAGKSITVLQGSELKVNAPAGYKVVKDTETDPDFWTYTVEELPDVCKIGDQGYKTLADAFNALTDDVNETITLLDNTSTPKVQVKKSFTLNLNGKTFTTTEFSVGVSQAPVGIKDCVISNGTIACAANQTYLVRLYGNSLTLKDVELDATGMVSPVTQERDNYTGAILATSGSVKLQGTTTIKNVATGLRAVSFNNYAGAANYKLGTLDFANGEDANVTIGGDVLIAGGTVVNADKATFSNTKFIVAAGGEYCTAATLANSGLEAIVGEYPTEPATGGNYKVNETALAYLEFADAAAAAEAGKKVQVCADVTCDAATFTAAAQLIVGTKKVEVTSLTLAGTKIELAKGGEFTNAFVTEADFVAPAEGQKLVNNEGTWTVVDIVYATLKVVKGDANVTAVVVSNATEEVALDDQGQAKFDKDAAVEITVYPTFADGYELDTEKSSALKATMADDATIEVFSKETQGGVVPEKPQAIEAADLDEAKQKAAAMTVQLSAEAAAAAGAGAAALTAKLYVSAEQVGPSSFQTKVEFRPEAVAEVTETATAVETALATQNEDLAADELTVTVAAQDVIPGLYYGIVAVDDLGAISTTEPTDWKLATQDGVSLTAQKPSPTRGFYRVKCAPDHPGQLKQ